MLSLRLLFAARTPFHHLDHDLLRTHARTHATSLLLFGLLFDAFDLLLLLFLLLLPLRHLLRHLRQLLPRLLLLLRLLAAFGLRVVLTYWRVLLVGLRLHRASRKPTIISPLLLRA